MVDGFFQKAKELFTGSNNDEFDQDLDREVSPASQDPYGDPADQYYGGYGDVTPTSQDPYGDPAEQYYGDVTPASQDPYGDPADEYSNLAPADQDPYGDPADEYGYGR